MNPYGRRSYVGRGGYGSRGGYGGGGGYSGRADSNPYAHLPDEQNEAMARQILGQIESNISWLQSNINNPRQARGGGGMGGGYGRGRYGRGRYGRGG
jgi:hypothetical protein